MKYFFALLFIIAFPVFAFAQNGNLNANTNANANASDTLNVNFSQTTNFNLSIASLYPNSPVKSNFFSNRHYLKKG